MLLGLIIVCGLLSIVYAVYTVNSLMAADAGTARMQEISAAVAEGAQAYLRRQYITIAGVGVVVFIALGLLLSWTVAIGFAIGAILSGAAGFIGMNVSVRANVRTAQAATKSLAGGLDIAFRSGAVTGSAGRRSRASWRRRLLRHSHRLARLRPLGSRDD